MKRTQIKDALRNIRKQLISFLSILIVVSLGVGIFLACRYSSQAIRNKGNAVYSESKYHDIEIRTTRGVTEEDVEAVKALGCVADAEPLFTVDIVAQNGSRKQVVHAVSITERMDIPWIDEGRLPEAEDEIVVATSVSDALGIAVGDHMQLLPMDDAEKSDYLYVNTFTVTGVMRHPDHLFSFDAADPDVLLSRSAFDIESAGVENTGILIRIEPETKDTFSEEYGKASEEALRSIAALGRERAKIRDEQIVSEAEQEISEGEEKLSSGKEELDNGRKELDDNAVLISDAQAQLSQVRQQLEQGKIELDSAWSTLETNKKKLDAAQAQLGSAYSQLTAAKNQLDNAAGELNAGKARLDASRAELADADAVLTAKRQELAEGKAKLDIARTTLDGARAQIDNERDRINAIFDQVWHTLHLEEITGITAPQLISIEELTEGYTLTLRETIHKHCINVGIPEDSTAAFEAALEEQPLWIYYCDIFDQIPEGEAAYAQGLEEYNEGSAQLQEGEEQYRAGLEAYEQGLVEYDESYAQFEAGKSEYNVNITMYETNLASYNSGLAEYEAGLAEYENAVKKYNDGEAEFAEKEKEVKEGSEKLEEGEQTWAENKEEYEKGLEELEAGKDRLDAYKAGNWILMDRDLNMTWHEFSENVRTFRNIGITFALLFVLLGILVCYATIGKIIDEQRKLVGTTKALGFFEREIFGKYLMFGCLAALLGCILGIALSYFVLQKMILDEVVKIFSVDSLPLYFSALPAVLSVVIGLCVAVSATRIACSRLLAQSATRLMSGEIPTMPAGPKKITEPKRTSLYRSLIKRNMRTDIKRVISTVVSIMGCCILLLIGFSLKFSFTDLIDKQFGEITDYDAHVTFLPYRDENARDEIRTAISESGAEYVSMYRFGSIIRVGADLEAAEIVCADPDSLARIYRLSDIRKKKEMRVPDAGLVIFSRLAEVYNLEVGDHISVLDEEGTYHDMPVSGIYNSYASRTIFVSSEYAKEEFGERTEGNSFGIRASGADIGQLQNRLSKEGAFLKFVDAAEEKVRYQNTAKAMDTVILVMVAMAGIMAAVVLLNLLRIQINQKKRELTIMRVNGFTTWETILYILRENVITTLIGTGLGLVLGNVIAKYNLHTIERVDLQMVRDINVKACLLSVLITFVFAAVINYLALRRIKTLNLSDVND